jgi:hypothetical protein
MRFAGKGQGAFRPAIYLNPKKTIAEHKRHRIKISKAFPVLFSMVGKRFFSGRRWRIFNRDNAGHRFSSHFEAGLVRPDALRHWNGELRGS